MKKSYPEIQIASKPDNAQFKKFADIIISEFRGEILNKINNLDTIYWDFKVKSEIITLHQQAFVGITVFPKDLDKSTTRAKELAERIGFKQRTGF